MENSNDYNKQIENLKKRIRFLFEAKKYEFTIKEAEQLLEYDPSNCTALHYITVCHIEMKQYCKAKEVALELIKNYPESSLGYGLCARSLLNSKDYKNAANYCKRAIELNAYDTNNYWVMAAILVAIGGSKNLYTAANFMIKALKIKPNDEGLHTVASAIYPYIGEYYKAKEEAEKALEINPESAGAHLNYGVALLYLGYLYKSINQFYAAIEIDPNDSAARHNIKDAKRYLNHRDQYYNFLEKRFFFRDLKMKKDSKSFIILAKLFIREKKYLDALKVFKRYLIMYPNAVEEHIKYANMLYDAGALSEALYYFKALKYRNSKRKEINEYIKDISTELKKSKIKEIHFCKIQKINYTRNKKRLSKIWAAIIIIVLVIDFIRILL